MKFSLIFDNSGDELVFDCLNPDVLDYYLDNLTVTNMNHFFICDKSLGQNIQKNLTELHQALVSANRWLPILANQLFPTYDNLEDYLDQRALNLLHMLWVKSQTIVYDIQGKRKEKGYTGLVEEIHDLFPDHITSAPLGTVISQLGKLQEYRKINDPLIHRLEEKFDSLRFSCVNHNNDEWVEFPNPFSRDLATFDRCNFSLAFDNLGRYSHNKWKYFDDDLEFDDENSFDQLLSCVTLSLERPEKIKFSPEYMKWCQEKNRVPCGLHIPLGNIPDLHKNIKKYRIMIFKNISNDNGFFINKE